MKKLIFYYSGWCELDGDTEMQRISEDPNLKSTILVRDYLNLPEKDKESYILENAATAISESLDGEWDMMSLEEPEDD